MKSVNREDLGLRHGGRAPDLENNKERRHARNRYDRLWKYIFHVRGGPWKKRRKRRKRENRKKKTDRAHMMMMIHAGGDFAHNAKAYVQNLERESENIKNKPVKLEK